MYKSKWQGIKDVIRYIPTIGAVAFIALYVYAAKLYPGGSNINPTASGFSFTDNYWCNLLSYYSINGQVNTSRPYAITATIFASSALGYFFYYLPLIFRTDKIKQLFIQVSGNVAMVFFLLLFTNFHDTFIFLSGIFSLLALVLIFIVLHEHKEVKLFWFGIFSAGLLALNAFMYCTDFGLELLPVIQKFTFAAVSGWIVSTNIEINRKLVVKRNRL
jgi:hypothetical protein